MHLKCKRVIIPVLIPVKFCRRAYNNSFFIFENVLLATKFIVKNIYSDNFFNIYI